jgi:hypothetical protein
MMTTPRPVTLRGRHLIVDASPDRALPVYRDRRRREAAYHRGVSRALGLPGSALLRTLPNAADHPVFRIELLVYRLRGLYRDRVVLELTPAPRT